MSISATSARLNTGLVSFAWSEWSQLGISAQAERRSPWAQDLEALVVFTLEVARADPRLFDAVLDWLLLNERHVSVRRWRALADDPLDRQLTEATIAWLAQHRPRARFGTSEAARNGQDTALVPVHPQDTGFPIAHPDEAFTANGLLRAVVAPAGQSRPPDLRLPIAFSLRLRQLLGIGARAEIVATMLTSPAPRLSASALARSAVYAKRNVQETLNGLVEAGIVEATVAGGEHRYGIDRDRWARLLHVEDALPHHVEWVQLLRALRRLLRWLRDRQDEHPDDGYLLASDLRQLLDELRGDFGYAGIAMPRRGTTDAVGGDLDGLVVEVLATLGIAG